MDRFVSDTVWRQLHPFGAPVPRRTVVRAWAAATTATVVAIALASAWASGDMAPWLYETEAGWGSSVAMDDANGRLGQRSADQSMTLEVENRGWRGVRIVGVGEDSAGVQTVQATADDRPIKPRSPYVLEPGNTIKITLFLRFTDCAAVSDRPWPIPIRVTRPWGIQTSHVLHLPIRAASDQGGWSVADRSDPRAVEWQRWIADDVCAIPYNKRAPGNR